MASSTLLWFSIAVLFLDAYDITLPRGDSITVSGSLIAAMAVIEGTVPALVVAALAVAIVHIARTGMRGVANALLQAGLRVGSVAIAAAAVWWIPTSTQGIDWARALLLPAVFLFLEVVGQQAISAYQTRRPFRQLLVGNIRRQALLVAAQVCVAGLAVVLYESVGVWTLVPVVVLLVLIRQAYAMLLEIRETYHQTLQVLVDAAESTEEGRAGHSERVAAIARDIGAGCGLSTAEVERISYAALLHDVHGISDSPHSAGEPKGSSSSVVRDVNFFSEVLPVLRVIEGEDSQGTQPSEREMLAGYVVALASDIDASLHPAVAAVHETPGIARVRADIPLAIKARAVASAVERGYPLPAID